MKKAFSLLELITSIIILGIILSGFSLFYQQIIQNSQTLNLFEKLYFLEKNFYKNAHSKIIRLSINPINSYFLQEKYLLQEPFEFKTLQTLDQNYSIYFK